jgi:predicted HTH transcriptional regulator
MREILVNALIHRDYSIAGGAVSLAIFDDRVEVWSTGRFPNGITPEALKRDHLSVLRNPIIADVFHRTGLIEKWGRGTNRVAEMCQAADIAPPDFKEVTGGAVVTFRVPVAGVATDTTPQVEALLRLLGQRGELSTVEILAGLKLKDRAYVLKSHLTPALAQGFVEMTIPDKPNSRFQKYRLNASGRALIARGPPT